MAKKNKSIKEEPLEQKLWKSADKLRKNMDAGEYKHIVLGLIFLKYISDAFEEKKEQLKLSLKIQKAIGLYLSLMKDMKL
jgi:type I restriction enzyme M protein